MIRRVVKSEAMDGTHVRTKEIGKSSYEFVEFVHRKVDKIIKRIAKVKLMERRDEWSQRRQTDHVATDMDEFIHAHPPRTAARWWKEFVRNEVFMNAEWNAEAWEPNAYQKVENLNNDVTSRYVHGDEFTVELRTDEFQDAKVTDATTKTMRNTTDEFSWERAEARLVDGVTTPSTRRVALDTKR